MIILDAHVDAWFDGAGDNADGLAVLVALARHFAKPENRPERTLVFVASAGHHSPGMNGPRNFIAANPDLAKRAVMMVNIEHVAQRNFSPARSTAADGYRLALADSGEAPIYAGITNRVAISRRPGPAGRRPLRHQLRVGKVEHVERRDRRLLDAQGRGPVDHHAGAAALSHHRRSDSMSSRHRASNGWRASWRSSSRRAARRRARRSFPDLDRRRMRSERLTTEQRSNGGRNGEEFTLRRATTGRRSRPHADDRRAAENTSPEFRRLAFSAALSSSAPRSAGRSRALCFSVAPLLRC